MNLADPTGLAPNLAGSTDYRTISTIIRTQGVAGLASNAGNNNRYFQTKDYGWVDTRHFATAAGDVAGGTPGVVEEVLGFGNEVVQYLTEWGDDYRSGFSPEDLPSNSAGIDFGGLLEDNPNASPADLFEQWAKTVGALDSSDPNFQAAQSALPATDPSYQGGQNRDASNVSSTPRGNSTSNDTGSSGANSSTGKKCSVAGSRIKRAC